MILLSTSSLAWYGLHRVFMFAYKAWFNWLDLALTKLNYDLWDEDYIKLLSDSFWLPVLSITAPSIWMNLKKLDKIMSMAKKLWTQIVTFSPPHYSDKEKDWFTKYLSKVKREYHVTVAVQNVESKFLFFIFPEFKNATLTEIKKVTWDVTLDISAIEPGSGMDILKAEKILWSSIKNIFLSDRQWPKWWLLPWLAWWGISFLPLESFLIKLKTWWYNWFFTLKVRPNELWVGSEEKVLYNLEYLINYYKKHFLNYK